jgi:hypothetical protein
MVRPFVALARVVPIVLVIVGCGTPPAAKRADVEAYLQRMAAWAPIEAETARTLERILETEFVDEAEVIRQIEDNAPRVRGHLQRVDEYMPRTTDVKAVHETYKKAWQGLLKGYERIETGFRTGEYSLVAEGRAAFAGWREGLLSTARQLSSLRDATDARQPTLQPS